jgi:uncharacterized protein YndB with AHSA1/START domain
MTNQPLIEDSIDIAAPPEAVWAIVSDLRRMGEWSPQCQRMWVIGRGVRLGTRTVNLNRQGWKRWPTNAKVVAFEPQRRLAFRIVENRTVWTYELEPTATGTRVTESRRAPHGVSRLSNIATRTVLGGTAPFEAGLATGIRRTLERIKAEAEAAA